MITYLFLDSSCLVKLFVLEAGSEQVIARYELVEDGLKAVSSVTWVEVRSAIRRRQRAGDTSHSDAEQAITSLRDESRRVIDHPVTATVIEVAATMVDRYNLRALDSIQLATAVQVREALPTGSALLFVASDHNLLEAAKAEAMDTWDPVPMQ